MRRQRIRHMIKSDINIIPFLDILLVLLMIFMIIPSRLTQNFEVNLPNSELATNIVNNKNLIITIEILGMGLYNLVVDNKYVEQVYLDRVASEICYKIRTVDDDITCFIAASKTIAYDEIIKVLNLLNNIGIHSIGMITSPST